MFKQNDGVVALVDDQNFFITQGREYTILKYNDGYKACPIIKVMSDKGERWIAANLFILKDIGPHLSEKEIEIEEAKDKQYTESQG